MEITIIGTGNMARGIATRALAGGHGVTLHGTSADKAAALAAELGTGARAGVSGDPITTEVVVLAVHYGVLAGVVASYGAGLDGKIVVDISNAVDFTTFEPIAVAAGSSAQELAAAAPAARVVKAFNTAFAGTLISGVVAGQPLDIFVASDDDAAKQAVTQIVQDGGMRAVDSGPLRRAHQLEALAFLHMAVQQSIGTGFASAVKVLADS